MQEKFVTIRKYKQVEDGTLQEIIYISEDGKFKSGEKGAVLQYEAKQKFDSIECEKKDLPFSELYVWYRLKNKEEEELFKHSQGLSIEHYKIYKENYSFNDEDIEPWDIKLPLNEWFCYKYDDGGDCRGWYEIYTISYVKKELQKFLERIE